VPGELQYYWNDPEVKRFWFVDGVGKRASGYIINQRSRPELWRAWHTAIRLAEAGCPVRAFIVGEPTRFFRSPKWINLFAEGLWSKKISLYVVPFGEITELNLGFYVQYVNALSGRIQEYRKQAVEAYQRRGKVFNKRCVFGLQIEREDEHPVQADPQAWPVLMEMCYRIADGTLKRQSDVSLWLQQAHGVERTPTWVGKLLADRPGVLDGVYRIYRHHLTPCEREEPSGLMRDFAVTESGNRRYKRTQTEGTPFDIYFPPGTDPIPPEIVDAARIALLGRRGRPRRSESKRAPRREEVLVPTRLLRCHHCGCGLTEFGPGTLPNGERRTGWAIRCCVITRLMQRHHLSYEAAKAHPAANDHPLYLGAQVSGAVWDLLKEELTRQAPPPHQEEPDVLRERDRLRGLQRHANEQLEALTINFLALTNPSPQVVRITEDRQRALEAEIEQHQQQIQMLSAATLEMNRRIETFAYYQREMGKFLNDADLPMERRRDIVEHMVEEVVLNMATGAFTVAIRTPEPVLRHGVTTNHTSSRGDLNIVLRGSVMRGGERRAA
jgi:hypothetical protein